ncbi:hypothetical protein AVEN_268822-1 [Araneus ventricosus]|uniref:Uncharacterized protein n=1 Tax=Araneus ventricosus TaxID=182803 RepID=A0A4Y2SIH5_ARAVE|nr:hypothetical protein AVEN_268822-1 [Araneus ventricosus]
MDAGTVHGNLLPSPNVTHLLARTFCEYGYHHIALRMPPSIAKKIFSPISASSVSSGIAHPDHGGFSSLSQRCSACCCTVTDKELSKLHLTHPVTSFTMKSSRYFSRGCKKAWDEPQ